MDFRTLLLAVDLTDDEEDLEAATAISAELGAHLMVIVVGVAPPPPTSLYGVMPNDVWGAEIGEGQAAARERAAEIRRGLEAKNAAATVQAHFIDRGAVASLVARCARYADLTLIQPQRGDAALQQNWVADGALFESGRPVLILPSEAGAGPVRFPAARRVVIGWDASVEASKAVRDAVGVMRRAAEVHAVLVDPTPSWDGHGPEPGADLATYLKRHGVATTVHRLPREGEDVARILQRAARDLDADLMVMGGFGHSRLRQRVFGGATTWTMRHTRVPVMMAH